MASAAVGGAAAGVGILRGERPAGVPPLSTQRRHELHWDAVADEFSGSVLRGVGDEARRRGMFAPWTAS